MAAANVVRDKLPMLVIGKEINHGASRTSSSYPTDTDMNRRVGWIGILFEE